MLNSVLLRFGFNTYRVGVTVLFSAGNGTSSRNSHAVLKPFLSGFLCVVFPMTYISRERKRFIISLLLFLDGLPVRCIGCNNRRAAAASVLVGFLSGCHQNSW